MSLFGFSVIVFLFLVADVSIAQVRTDTLDWRRYFPLDVGNEWQWGIWSGNIPTYKRMTIVSDTLVGERCYYRFRYEEKGPYANSEDVPKMRFARYDTAGTVVFLNSIAADTSHVDPVYDLRRAFGDTISTPGALWGDFQVVSGGYNERVWIHGEFYNVAAVKEVGARYAADIGVVYDSFWDGPQTILDYAKVDGQEYGTLREVFLVSTESPPSNQDEITLSVFPNPVQREAMIRVTSPTIEHLDIEVYDAVGRVVRHVFSGRKSAPVLSTNVDLNTLAAGSYFVVLRSGDETIRIAPFVVLP